jgi:nitroreductase
MTNLVLDTIQNRRSVLRFDNTPIEKEKMEAIVNAGRWAPSWLNKQPWKFILVKDKNIKEQLSENIPTPFIQGLKEAPVCIAVVVDTTEDPFHYIEDGAVATQNIALAAHSLGLSSCWIGIFDVKNQKKSAEAYVRKILGIPQTYRVISILPIGYSRYEPPKPDRKRLDELVYRDRFGQS